MAHVSQKPSTAQWASLTLSQGRTVRRDAMNSSLSSSQAVDVKSGTGASSRHGVSTQGGGHHSNSTLPHAQVARSELNVRVPRGKSIESHCSRHVPYTATQKPFLAAPPSYLSISFLCYFKKALAFTVLLRGNIVNIFLMRF